MGKNSKKNKDKNNQQSNKKNIIIQVLAFIGFLLTIKLAHIYYVANYDKYALASFCSINDFIDCDGAARSPLSQCLGIPLAYWGMFFYITVLFLTIVDELKNVKFLKFLEVFKNPMSYITVLGSLAFTISMVLAGMSIFEIKKLCILCVITYIIDLCIALVASSGSIINIFSSIKTTVLDFIDGAKKYTKTFLVLLIASISFITYSAVTLDFVPNLKAHKSLMKYRTMKHNPYRINGNTLGSPNGSVVIELYSDFVCPMCYTNNIMLHQAAREFNNITIHHHNLPFDKECNPYIGVNMHPGACFMSKVALSAGNQGNYWGMSTLLYENQPRNIEDAMKLARELGLNPEKLKNDIEAISTEKEIQSEIDEAYRLNLDSTPTMIINGDKIVGVKPYYKLKEILIEHGAK